MLPKIIVDQRICSFLCHGTGLGTTGCGCVRYLRRQISPSSERLAFATLYMVVLIGADVTATPGELETEPKSG